MGRIKKIKQNVCNPKCVKIDVNRANCTPFNKDGSVNKDNYITIESTDPVCKYKKPYCKYSHWEKHGRCIASANGKTCGNIGDIMKGKQEYIKRVTNYNYTGDVCKNEINVEDKRKEEILNRIAQ